MASLTKENDRGYVCWRIRFFLNENRLSLRLGKVNKRTAEDITRHVRALLQAYETGMPAPSESINWATTVDAKIQEKLSLWGLCDPGNPAAKTDAGRLLGPFLDKYIEGRTDCVARNITNFKQTRKLLVEYFKEDKPIRAITAADGDRWRRWLTEKPLRRGNTGRTGKDIKTLSVATVSKHVKRAKTIFSDAVKDRLISVSPFILLKGGSEANKARFFFVDAELTAKVLAACPDHDWKLIFALARYTGMRCPSEVLKLRWDDVMWETNRIRIDSSKTGLRYCPIFPELAPILKAAKADAPADEVYCVRRYRGDVNLGTQMTRLLDQASIPKWPKVFINLRSTRRTELQEAFPSHVVDSWLGHSSEVAEKHYLQVTDSHWEAAATSPGKKAVTTKASRPKKAR